MTVVFLLPTAYVSAQGTVATLSYEVRQSLCNRLETHILAHERGFISSEVDGAYRLDSGVVTHSTYVMYTVYAKDSGYELLDTALLHELCVIANQESIGVIVNGHMRYYS